MCWKHSSGNLVHFVETEPHGADLSAAHAWRKVMDSEYSELVQAMFKNAVWPNLCDMMCYYAVAHPLQASVCWVFRDSLLHTLVLTSGWVVVAFLSAGSRLAIFISSLTSARTFYPNNCHSLDVFSFFGPFCINPWYGCYGTSFRNIQTSTLTQKTMSHSK